MKLSLLLCAFAFVPVLGCGDSSETTGGSGPTGGSGGTGGAPVEGGGGNPEMGGSPNVDPRGACTQEERVGRFSVEKQSDFGVVQGVVSDGIVPASIPDVISDDGTCRVLKRRNLSCTPACVGQETCGEDGECIPYPRQISVGTVTIEGLTKPTVMEPAQPGNTYFAPDADNPPFEVGSAITLTATGDQGHGPFELYGVGSEPLAETPIWTLEEGQDLVVTWEPGTIESAKVAVELTIDQHGTSPLSLSCTFEDTGTGTVPSAVVDQLINSGVSGFPNGRIMRLTADKIVIDVGCVDMLVGSPVIADVAVTGFTPCDSPDDCPPPQTCNLQIELCE